MKKTKPLHRNWFDEADLFFSTWTVILVDRETKQKLSSMSRDELIRELNKNQFVSVAGITQKELLKQFKNQIKLQLILRM